MACRCTGNGTPAKCTYHSLVGAQDELHAANYFTPQAWACVISILLEWAGRFRWPFVLPAAFVSAGRFVTVSISAFSVSTKVFTPSRAKSGSGFTAKGAIISSVRPVAFNWA